MWKIVEYTTIRKPRIRGKYKYRWQASITKFVCFSIFYPACVGTIKWEIEKIND